MAIARPWSRSRTWSLTDEPTGALDTESARSVLALLRDCVDRTSQTLVMVTHDPVAASFADSVVFLVDGRSAGRMTEPTPATVAGQLARLAATFVSVTLATALIGSFATVLETGVSLSGPDREALLIMGLVVGVEDRYRSAHLGGLVEHHLEVDVETAALPPR